MNFAIIHHASHGLDCISCFVFISRFEVNFSLQPSDFKDRRILGSCLINQPSGFLVITPEIFVLGPSGCIERMLVLFAHFFEDCKKVVNFAVPERRTTLPN